MAGWSHEFAHDCNACLAHLVALGSKGCDDEWQREHAQVGGVKACAGSERSAMCCHLGLVKSAQALVRVRVPLNAAGKQNEAPCPFPWGAELHQNGHWDARS